MTWDANEMFANLASVSVHVDFLRLFSSFQISALDSV